MEHNLLPLPARFCGIALITPARFTDTEFLSSTTISEAFKKCPSSTVISVHRRSDHRATGGIFRDKKMRIEREHQASEELKESLPAPLKCCMDLAQEKGASSWLTSMPIEEFGFTLHKGASQDALALRYNWEPLHTASTCNCGTKFLVEHALSCHKNGSPPSYIMISGPAF